MFALGIVFAVLLAMSLASIVIVLLVRRSLPDPRDEIERARR